MCFTDMSSWRICIQNVSMYSMCINNAIRSDRHLITHVIEVSFLLVSGDRVVTMCVVSTSLLKQFSEPMLQLRVVLVHFMSVSHCLLHTITINAVTSAVFWV